MRARLQPAFNRTLEGAAKNSCRLARTAAAILVGDHSCGLQLDAPQPPPLSGHGLYLPGVVRRGAGEVAIAVDCSGSVSGRVNCGYLKPKCVPFSKGRQRPERVYVLYFDAVVHKVRTPTTKPDNVLISTLWAEEVRSSVRASNGSTGVASGRGAWSF